MTATTGKRLPRRWPLLLVAPASCVAVWSGWVGLGGMAGFGVVHPLPGIWDQFSLDTAITLPIGVEAYAAYALSAWLSPATMSTRTRRFAKRSAIGSLILGASGQAVYHLLAAAGREVAPWPVTALVSCLPVLVLGMAAALAHMIRADAATADTELGVREQPANSAHERSTDTPSGAFANVATVFANRLANSVEGHPTNSPANTANGDHEQSREQPANSGTGVRGGENAAYELTAADETAIRDMLASSANGVRERPVSGTPPVRGQPQGKPANSADAVREQSSGQSVNGATNSATNSSRSRTPLAEYVELAREHVPANGEIPGPRSLANNLGCSPSTASKVIAELRRESE